jgi:hypothetical protein
MSIHLYNRGFMPGYEIWTEHGENYFSPSILQPSIDNVDDLDEMVSDLSDTMHRESVEEEPIEDAKAFYAMLAASQEPLHSFTSASRLTTVAA